MSALLVESPGPRAKTGPGPLEILEISEDLTPRPAIQDERIVDGLESGQYSRGAHRSLGHGGNGSTKYHSGYAENHANNPWPVARVARYALKSTQRS